MKNIEFPNELDASFWNQHWLTGQTGWDMGQVSPPIKEYFEQYKNKAAAILIPGCGNAYEAEYLVKEGFQDITLLDIAPEAARRLKEKFKNCPAIKVICGDFFDIEGRFDVLVEQTFFCAQVLERRPEYVRKAFSLLKRSGKIVGVLFNRDFGYFGPPFGGNEVEYRKLFEPYFEIRTLQVCTNSIAPRAGFELFINFQKKMQ